MFEIKFDCLQICRDPETIYEPPELAKFQIQRNAHAQSPGTHEIALAAIENHFTSIIVTRKAFEKIR